MATNDGGADPDTSMALDAAVPRGSVERREDAEAPPPKASLSLATSMQWIWKSPAPGMWIS